MSIRIYAALIIGLATVLGAISSPAQAAEVAGGTIGQWTKHRDVVRTDPSLLRYYTFEHIRQASDPVPNLAAGGAEPLVFRIEAAGAKQNDLRLTAGRWPGKQAVRIDQGCFAAKAPDAPDRAFTAVIWFRKHGQGTQRGNSGTTNGMLLAVGNGYWEGWRLTTSYPSNSIGFEIGRPQPSSSVGTSTGIVTDEVWHHLAATWDGRQMCIYVDGELAASQAFDGAYTKPAGNDWLRVGFADSGIGSVAMDVDEVAIYGKALSAAQVLGDLYFYANLSAKQLESWTSANAAILRKEYSSAEKTLSDLAESEGLHRDVLAAVNLRLVDVRLRQGSLNVADAAGELARMVDTADLPSRLNRQATAKLVELTKAGAALPAPLYAKAMTMPNLSQSDMLALELGLGHSLAASGDLAGAQKQYQKLADDTRVPVQWRGLTLMSLAKAQTRAGDYASARATYEKVKSMPGTPRHWATTIGERLQEVQRLQAGRPAQDEMAGRTQLPARPTPGLTLYVATNGKDGNPGTRERPLASLEQARDQIRMLRSGGKLPAGGVRVVVAGGRYPAERTFQLDAQDSGTIASPITYAAAPGEKPIFDGGKQISGFTLVRDEAVLKRLPEEAKGKVYQADLKAQQVPLGVLELGGFASARGFKTHPTLELFFDGQAMPMARWPNEGYVRISEVPAGTKGVFTYSGDRLERWKQEKDPWLYGYWFYDWADGYEKVASIDTAAKRITLAPPSSTYGEGGNGFKPGQRFYAVNMLCEVDRPGEWYLDRDTGILYFYAPSDPAKAKVEVSVFEKPMVEMQKASYVTLEGLTWANGRGDAIVARDVSDCLIAGCTIRQFAGNALEISGSRNGVLGCDMNSLGRGGISMAAGDRKTLTAGGGFVENCHIYDFSRLDHTYTPAVLLNGAGNRIAHNLFHDANSSAMRIEGNDHVIEYNEVRNVLKDSDDQGASDSWGNPTFRGIIFRYNYWHDMGNGLDCGQAGIRLDDFISGVVIYGNIFQRCAAGGFGAVQINCGKENYIENNLFIDCKVGISGGSADEAGWARFLAGATGKGYVDEVKTNQPPYSVRYPELQKLTANLSNNVWRNVVVDCRAFILSDQRVNQMDNAVSSENPGLKDPAAGDFAVKKDSPLWGRLSFDAIPADVIGLYVDGYRKSR